MRNLYSDNFITTHIKNSKTLLGLFLALVLVCTFQRGRKRRQLSMTHFPITLFQALPSILGDNRFKVMFENPDYQVDEQSEDFRLLNPIVSKVEQKRKKKLRQLAKEAAAAEQASLNISMNYTTLRTTSKTEYIGLKNIRKELPSCYHVRRRRNMPQGGFLI